MTNIDKNIPIGIINSAKDLGALIRKKRREQKLTQAQVASVSGVGIRFISELERGKPTCYFDKSLKVASVLGFVHCVAGDEA